MDRNLIYPVAALFMLIALSGVTKAENHEELAGTGSVPSSVLDGERDFFGDIRVYAKHCAEVIGAPMPAFNCEQDGVEIPITLGGHAAPVSSPRTCDRPALLSTTRPNSCQDGARLGRLEFDEPNVVGAFICRKIFGDRGKFDEIAAIQHNLKNGATCWYLGFSRRALFGQVDDKREVLAWSRLEGDVLSPMDSRFVNRQPGLRGDNRVEWLSAEGEFCRSCHTPDPFVHTPHVRQAQLMRDGDPLVPTVYNSPDDLTFRFWNPLNPRQDKAFNEVIKFRSDAAGAACTVCHAISTSSFGSVPPFVSEAAGGPLSSARSDSVDQRHKSSLAWMHVSDQGEPFELRTPTVDTRLAYLDIARCMKRPVPGLCAHVEVPGRPPFAIELRAPTPRAGLTLSQGAVVTVAARQRNHDFGDRIEWSIGTRTDRMTLPRTTGYDETVSFVANCGPDREIAIEAVLVGNAGAAKVPRTSVSRTWPCHKAKISRWSPKLHRFEAMPYPELAGTLSDSFSGRLDMLLVGDDNRNHQLRSFLTFPIQPPASVSAPLNAQLRLALRPQDGSVAANFGALTVNRYDYGDALESGDYNLPGQFKEGFASADVSQAGEMVIDVTRHVQSAWNESLNHVQFGLWFRQGADGDNRADMLRIENRPRIDAVGGFDFNARLQPVLTIEFE